MSATGRWKRRSITRMLRSCSRWKKPPVVRDTGAGGDRRPRKRRKKGRSERAEESEPAAEESESASEAAPEEEELEARREPPGDADGSPLAEAEACMADGRMSPKRRRQRAEIGRELKSKTGKETETAARHRESEARVGVNVADYQIHHRTSF